MPLFILSMIQSTTDMKIVLFQFAPKATKRRLTGPYAYYTYVIL